MAYIQASWAPEDSDRRLRGARPRTQADNRDSVSMDFSNWHNYNLPHCGPQDQQQMTEQRTPRRLAAILAADVVG